MCPLQCCFIASIMAQNWQMDAALPAVHMRQS
jgi:hypothetical protein